MAESRRATRTSVRHAHSLLILSPKARSITPEVEAKLRKAFAGSMVVDFDPRMEIDDLASPTAKIIVAGGDGTNVIGLTDYVKRPELGRRR